jgi:hypothetical protein
MTPEILEKDVWVCWTLDALFSINDGVEMAFKGGTSLSKAYDVISRFSEDIDITVAHDNLDPTIKPFAEELSRKLRDRMTETLNEKLYGYVKDSVEPHFRRLLTAQFSSGGWDLDIMGNGEELRLSYPSVAAVRDEIDPNYIREYVKIEFGGRNAIVPTEVRVIHAYLEGHVGDAILPQATANVLAGTRTFWEKATLAHVHCHRPTTKANAERLSRHWYDLYKLSDNHIGIQAVADRGLLADVVKYKSLFFNSGYANYDKCLNKELRLIPDVDSLTALRDDYQVMLDKAMIHGDIPAFDQIVERLQKLEAQINA